MKKICISKNGVAYLHIDTPTIKRFGLSMEDASATVSIMDSIKGSLIWLAFIENGDGSTRVRLRSRFVEVQELATHYNGGGHACPRARRFTAAARRWLSFPKPTNCLKNTRKKTRVGYENTCYK
jgi:nanoRNase/pAp phosphatase (c-di-AMP/oligoRNAs hydrolase)